MLGAATAGQKDPEGALPVYIAGYACITAGVGLVHLFTWKVFRATDRWAKYFFWCCAGTLALTSLPPELPGFAPPQWLQHLGSAARVSAGLWGALECARYFRLLDKRAALGLGDVVLRNRFFLWGVGSAATAILMAFTITFPPTDPGSMPVFHVVVISSVTTFVGCCQWLAFVPPAAYTRWVRGGEQASAV